MLTLTTAANQDLATLATVKTALGITDNTEDATLPPLISSASAAIAGYCNRVFIEEDVEETLRLCGRQHELMLARYPVSDIGSVTEGDAAIDPSGYEVDLAIGVISRLFGGRSGCWSGGKIVVAYSAGYPIADVPADLVQAVIMLVAHYRSTAARDPLLRAEETTDVERLEYFIPSAAGLPAPVEALLSGHRKPGGA